MLVYMYIRIYIYTSSIYLYIYAYIYISNVGSGIGTGRLCGLGERDGSQGVGVLPWLPQIGDMSMSLP